MGNKTQGREYGKYKKYIAFFDRAPHFIHEIELTCARFHLVLIWMYSIWGLGQIDMPCISTTELLWRGHRGNVSAHRDLNSYRDHPSEDRISLHAHISALVVVKSAKGAITTQ